MDFRQFKQLDGVQDLRTYVEQGPELGSSEDSSEFQKHACFSFGLVITQAEVAKMYW